MTVSTSFLVVIVVLLLPGHSAIDEGRLNATNSGSTLHTFSTNSVGRSLEGQNSSIPDQAMCISVTSFRRKINRMQRDVTALTDHLLQVTPVWSDYLMKSFEKLTLGQARYPSEVKSSATNILDAFHSRASLRVAPSVRDADISPRPCSLRILSFKKKLRLLHKDIIRIGAFLYDVSPRFTHLLKMNKMLIDIKV